MPPKLLRKILLAPLVLLFLFEVLAWLFFRFPVEPLREVNLSNDIPGFKKEVRLVTGDDNVRYLDWGNADKGDGTLRILCVGGLATQGPLQGAEDTWWGQLHLKLKQQGLKVATAARGFDRVGVVAMAAAMPLVVERLKPDLIIVNAGFDDVILHPSTYTYDKDKFSKLPPPPKPSAFKEFLVKFSQTARFKRSMSRDSEAKQDQNRIGRPDALKKFFTEKREQIQKLREHEGFVRRGSVNDPMQEFIDGLAAFRDLAQKNGAALVLSGEPSLHDSVLNLTEQELLLAYIFLGEPDARGNVPAARPTSKWVMNELERFAQGAEKFASDNKIPWIDLNGKVPRTTENFFSDVIMTDAGAAKAGELLAAVVAPVLKSKAR